MVHNIKEDLFDELSFCLEQQKKHLTLSDQSSLAGVELVYTKGESNANTALFIGRVIAGTVRLIVELLAIG